MAAQQRLDPLPRQRRDQHGRADRRARSPRSASRARGRVEPVDLVPDLQDRRVGRRRVDAEIGQHRLDVAPLRLGLGMADVAHVQDEVGLHHLLQRGAEGRDQRGRQVGDEADRVGQDDAPAARQLHLAHGRIERREHLVLGDHGGAGEAVEQRRLAGVGVADDGHHRIRHALAPRAVQRRACAPRRRGRCGCRRCAPRSGAGRSRSAPRRGRRGSRSRRAGAPGGSRSAPAGSSGRSRCASSTCSRPSRVRRALAEDLQDQAGAVEHLAVPGLLQVALLDGADRMIDDDEARPRARRSAPRSPRPCRSRAASPAAGAPAARSRPRARRGRSPGPGRPPPRAGPAIERGRRRRDGAVAVGRREPRACPRRSGTSTMARVGARRRSTGTAAATRLG